MYNNEKSAEYPAEFMYYKESFTRMNYYFSYYHPRKIQVASFCLFDKPLLHPSRIMPVHDFVYMLDGEWSAGIGSETFTVYPDDVLILPANLPHVGIKPCSPNTRTMYFHIYAHECDEICDSKNYSNGVVLSSIIKADTAPNLKELFHKIILTQTNEAISSAYVNALLYELGELSQKRPKNSLAWDIHNFIISSDKILSNREIADHFSISTKTAEVAFKEEYACTIHSFVIDNKLKKAQQYLVDYPNMKMASIAAMLGFYDEFHFSKAFKSKFGLSPGEFRKMKKGSQQYGR